MIVPRDHGTAPPAETARRRLLVVAALVASRCPDSVISVARSARTRLRRHRAPAKFRAALNDAVVAPSQLDLLAVTSTTAVFRVTPKTGLPFILKAANSRAAIDAHRQEADALQELADLVATSSQRQMIAKVLDRSDIGATAWFTQTALSGDAIESGPVTGADVVRAAEAIRPFYELTGETVPGIGPTLRALIDEPIEIVEAYFPGQAPGLEVLRRWLLKSLDKQPLFLCRIHGDYVAQNVLIAKPDRAEIENIVGIVDWTFDRTPLPPEIDLVHYAIDALASQRGEEYGQTVSWLLTGEPPKIDIRPLLAALACGPNLFKLNTGVALAWLHHVARSLDRPHDLSQNPVWIANNLNNVIEAVNAASSTPAD